MDSTPTTAELFRAILRTPAAKGLALAGLLCAVALGGAMMWVVQQARTGSCKVPEHPELSMQELIAVKKRFMAYRKTPDAGMRLSADEVAMLIEDQTSAPMYLAIDGEKFRAEIAIAPEEDGTCWPVSVRGAMSIEDGKAFVLPEILRIGAIDLSGVVEGSRIELRPEHMPSSRSANLLQKTRAAAVVDGGLQVQLRDPQSSLFSND